MKMDTLKCFDLCGDIRDDNESLTIKVKEKKTSVVCVVLVDVLSSTNVPLGITKASNKVDFHVYRDNIFFVHFVLHFFSCSFSVSEVSSH